MNKDEWRREQCVGWASFQLQNSTSMVAPLSGLHICGNRSGVSLGPMLCPSHVSRTSVHPGFMDLSLSMITPNSICANTLKRLEKSEKGGPRTCK